MIPPAAPEDPFAPRQWWETRWFVAAMILAAIVPLIYPPIPPLVDLLGHMGRYRVELDLAHSPDLQRYYEFHWALIGNLGVDLLIIPVSKIFGLELGVKLIVMMIPPLTVAGFLWVAREVHHRIPPTTLFALPFAYGHPFLYGFVNFALSMALAFLAFGLWLRLGRLGKTRLRAALFVPISFIVFISHTFGWGVLGLMCFSAEAVRQHDSGLPWWEAALRGALHAAGLALPLLLLLFWRHEASGGVTAYWFNFETKQMWVQAALRDRWRDFDRLSVLLTIGVMIVALLVRSLGFSRNLAFSALILLLCFILLPRIVFGSAYADMRLVPYMFAVALLAIRFRGDTDLRLGRLLAVVGLLFVVVRFAANTASLNMASDDAQHELRAVEHVPQGSRALFLVGWKCGADWPLPRKSQLGGALIVRRHALENSMWRMPGAQLLSVKSETHLGWFGSDPSQIVLPDRCGTLEHWSVNKSLAEFPRDKFDYVWIVDAPPFDARLTTGWQQLYRYRASILYRIRPLR